MTIASPPVPLHRNRDFVLLWSGQAISVLGSNISSTAYPLLVLALTNSPAAAGFVGFAGKLPLAIFQLPAGLLVDRLDRKRLMMICDLVRAAALLSVVVALWFRQLAIPHLAAVAFVQGLCNVTFNLAQTAAIRNVVPPEQMVTALSQTEARELGVGLAGQPLGGVLFGVSQALPFLADAISYLLSLVSLLFIRRPFHQERNDEPKSLRDDLVEGVVWLWRQPFLRATILLVAGSNFAFQGLILSVIVLSRNGGATPAEIGLIMGGFGVGGLLGAFAAPWLQERLPGRAVVVGATWVWAVLTPLLLVAPPPYLLGAVFAVAAFVGPIWNVILGAYQIRLTPDALLGRVGAAGAMMAYGVIPLGALVAGLLLERGGTTVAVLALGAVLLVLAIVATLSRTVRDAPDLTAIEPS